MASTRAWYNSSTFWLSFGVSMIYFSAAFGILHLNFAEYGWVVFAVFPLMVGFTIGLMKDLLVAVIASIIAYAIFLGGLYVFAYEGVVCIVLSTPLIAVASGIGVLLGYLLRKKSLLNSGGGAPVLLIPALGFLFVPVENALVKGGKEVMEVSTSVEFPYPAMEVYDAIKHVDTLDAPKPWLMQLDLPVPMKCILEKEEVGALRTCYFEGGTITERVTALEKGKLLRMDVIDYQLTGRKWLGFEEAIYTFEAIGENRCKMTRSTTYTSQLKPRFYWEPLEKMGIEQEHDYVIANLGQDLLRRNGAR